MPDFKLAENKYLFFDIFHKNNELILICPVYTAGVDISKLHVLHDARELSLKNKHSEINYEPTEILIYSFSPDKSRNTVQVKYGDVCKEFVLEHFTTMAGKTVAITTLFKDDHALIPVFYDYYRNQGVKNFYLYYNGKITDDIRQRCKLRGVVLIEWDFPYWNEDFHTRASRFQHHAQLGQIHHALYRYGKDENEYMIFCDLDEYMYVPEKRLATYIYKNPTINIFGFCNIWATTMDNTIPDKIPTKIKTAKNKIPFGQHSKCIYKTHAVLTLSIHSHKKMAEPKNASVDHIMFHFYNWSNPDRVKDTDTETVLVF
jgi:hypothetical protein